MNEDAQKPVVNVPASELRAVPITLKEIEEEVQKRVSMIDHEFNRGFDFIKTQPKSVTIFGGARVMESSEHYKRAERIAAKLADIGYSVLTGGGPGIMEAANKGAFENHGKSLGLNIKLPHEQVRNPYLNDSVEFYYFFVRKVIMSFSAEAYLFFPGGYGTFDELFEILTLIQTKKIEPVPVILIGSDFWNPVKDFLVDVMLKKYQTIEKADLDFFVITDNEDEIIDIVRNVPVRYGVRLNHTDPDDLPPEQKV